MERFQTKKQKNTDKQYSRYLYLEPSATTSLNNVFRYLAPLSQYEPSRNSGTKVPLRPTTYTKCLPAPPPTPTTPIVLNIGFSLQNDEKRDVEKSQVDSAAGALGVAVPEGAGVPGKRCGEPRLRNGASAALTRWVAADKGVRWLARFHRGKRPVPGLPGSRQI